MRYLVGIDNGSQSSKVTIFDEHGTAVASGRCDLRAADRPRPGVVEHPGDDLWESIGVASRAALAGFAGDPGDIVAVGLCTIRFCRALLRDDGTLARPVLSWMDDRVGRPYEHESDDVAKVTASSGYVTHRLTGRFVDAAGAYQGQWPIDAATWAWSTDEAVIARYGIRRDQLVDLVEPGGMLGTVTSSAATHTGLPEGLPVVATSNDKAVEALGSGVGDDGSTLLISLGTYIAGMTAGRSDRADATSFWTNFGGAPGAYLYESAGIRRGMWTISWFRDLLGPGAVGEAAAAGLTVEELLGSEAAAVPRGADGLVTVLDWLADPATPHRRGTMLGFDARHGRGHVFRSLLEAIALTMHDRTSRMATEIGRPFERVVLSGGGSKSDLLCQIVADVFGLPTARMQTTDSAGLGAAMCAGVALGVHESFDAARAAMVRATDVFLPHAAATEFYGRLEAVHREVAASTDAVSARLATVVG